MTSQQATIKAFKFGPDEQDEPNLSEIFAARIKKIADELPFTEKVGTVFFNYSKKKDDKEGYSFTITTDCWESVHLMTSNGRDTCLVQFDASRNNKSLYALYNTFYDGLYKLLEEK